MSPAEQLATLAKAKLGTDFTDDKVVPDDVSCAYAVTTILHEQDAREPICIGTFGLLTYFQLNPRWQRIYEPKAGCVVVCITGQGNNPKIPHGHTGIYLDSDLIASNSSATGLWTQNYTRLSWRQHFYYEGGYPIYLYEKIS